jgi:hypothetical protein
MRQTIAIAVLLRWHCWVTAGSAYAIATLVFLVIPLESLLCSNRVETSVWDKRVSADRGAGGFARNIHSGDQGLNTRQLLQTHYSSDKATPNATCPIANALIGRNI